MAYKVVMSWCVRGAFGVSGWSREYCECVTLGSVTARGRDATGNEWVWCATLRWFGQAIRMNEDDFGKRV